MRVDENVGKAAKKRLLHKIASADSELQLLADELRALPKVRPRASFRERVRARVLQTARPAWLTVFLRQGMAFGVVLMLVIGVSFTTFIARVDPTLAEEVARLTVHDGTAKIRDAAALFYRSAVNGDIVRVGDTVRVDKGSLASLAFPDSSTLELNSGTEVSITDVTSPSVGAVVPQLTSKKADVVKLALLTGEVQATAAKTSGAVKLEIATPSGVVAGNQASFAVKVDGAGEATVTTTDEHVIVTPTTAAAPSANVVAGQTATLDAGVVTVTDDLASTATATPIAEAGPSAEAVQTEIDILRIRLFDALASAQAGDMTTAQRIEEGVAGRLDAIFHDLGTDPVSEKRVETLTLLIAEYFKDGPEAVAAMQSYLSMMDTQQSLLGIYAVAPQTLRGLPTFDIVAASHYQPTGELKRLFVALRTQQLATVSARPLADAFVDQVAREYGATLTRASTPRLLAGMGDQPIYTSALRTMRRTAPAHVRYLIDKKVIALDGVLAKYRGEVLVPVQKKEEPQPVVEAPVTPAEVSSAN